MPLWTSSRLGQVFGSGVGLAEKEWIELAGDVTLEFSWSSPSGEKLFAAVAHGVVVSLGNPAGPDHAEPSSGEDPHGVGVPRAPGAGSPIAVSGPCGGMSRVIGEAGNSDPRRLVGGVAEPDGSGLA